VKAFTQKECISEDNGYAWNYIWQTPGQQDTSMAIMHLVV